MSDLNGRKIVILVENAYNDLEFWYPKYRLQEAGAEVVVAGPQKGAVYGGKAGIPCRADVSFADVDAAEVDGVVIPGGYAPDRIRRYPEALNLVRALFEAGKLVAHICHAGWVPVSAGIMKGMRTTSFSAIKDDLENAGAMWVDEAVVVDRNLISSRTPDDLPVFMKAVIGFLGG